MEVDLEKAYEMEQLNDTRHAKQTIDSRLCCALLRQYLIALKAFTRKMLTLLKSYYFQS